MPTVRELIDSLDINGHHMPRGTDKESAHSYGAMYDQELARFLDRDTVRLMEIGVQGGGCMLLWQALFPTGTQLFVDIEDKVAPEVWTYLEMPRATVVFADAYNEGFVTGLQDDQFDVIIDDGPHTLDSQIQAVQGYAAKLKVGGVLIIEDVQHADHFQILLDAVPPGFIPRTYDLRHIKGRYDDLVFVMERA